MSETTGSAAVFAFAEMNGSVLDAIKLLLEQAETSDELLWRTSPTRHVELHGGADQFDVLVALARDSGLTITRGNDTVKLEVPHHGHLALIVDLRH